MQCRLSTKSSSSEILSGCLMKCCWAIVPVVGELLQMAFVFSLLMIILVWNRFQSSLVSVEYGAQKMMGVHLAGLSNANESNSFKILFFKKTSSYALH